MSLQSPDLFVPTSGKPSLPWSIWIRTFTNYIDAAGFSELEDKRKKALLLHCLGIEGQRLYFARVAEIDHNKASYTEMIKELQNQHGKVNIAGERSKFRARKQHHGETISEYLAALRELASNCDFKTLEDEIIRDQMTEFTIYPRIREKLISKTYTLQEAVKFALEIEEGILVSKEMTSRSSTPVNYTTVKKTTSFRRHSYNRQHPNKPANNPKTRPPSTSGNYTPQRVCYRCGSQYHVANDPKCPAKNTECRNCKKIGHFDKVCKGGNFNQSVKTIGIADTAVDTEGSEPDYVVLKINHELSQCGTYKYANVYINGVQLSMVIDTGATVSLIDYTTFKEHFTSTQLEPSTIRLTNFDNRPIETKGYFHASVKLLHRTTHTKIYVTTKGCCILGLDLFDSLCMSIEQVQQVHTNSTVLDEFPHLFKGIGTAKRFLHKSVLLPDAVPVCQKQRPIPFALLQDVNQEVDKLLALLKKRITQSGSVQWLSQDEEMGVFVCALI